ncbi:FAD-dependent monooxygenase [Actinoplanes sp. G11-F43]|uniref:FAD-dependent monooxygenase n=1 Tax=Actinoplanes sp. G11-F43 TaxID=3424130 RepID=UPI003D33C3F1
MTENRSRRKALVVGAGITGLATAIRLRQIGWEPVLIERAPERRTGGYFIMLFGTGAAAARRLGALDAIGTRGGPGVTTYEIDRQGRRRPGLSIVDLSGSPRPLLRGDVENGLFQALPADVEIRYSTVPSAIEQNDDEARVELHDLATGTRTTESFDLVVGADGLRSTVRRLAFGDGTFVHPLNYMIAATVLDRPVDGFGQSEGLVLAEPGRSAATFAFADHAPSLLFSYRTADVDAEFQRAPIDSLRAAFGPEPAGPVLEELFQRYEQAPDALFDSVMQVRMPRWHRGRVVLVGDAAWCLTLYSGMGASTGMAGGDLLGTLLQQHPDDVPGALGAWETRLRPFITDHQAAALNERLIFVPQNRREQVMRAGMIRMMRSPGLRNTLGRLMPATNALMEAKNVDIAA